ncbi:MAG: hypothetical protein ACI9N9_000380 [Enterobacterales bacterium]|jgi:hypothetical protein
MKEAIDVVKSDLKAKLLLWDNIKNPKFKVVLVLLFIALVSLKIFTTVLTFDWLASLFK